METEMVIGRLNALALQTCEPQAEFPETAACQSINELERWYAEVQGQRPDPSELAKGIQTNMSPNKLVQLAATHVQFAYIAKLTHSIGDDLFNLSIETALAYLWLALRAHLRQKRKRGLPATMAVRAQITSSPSRLGSFGNGA